MVLTHVASPFFYHVFQPGATKIFAPARVAGEGIIATAD